MRTHALVAAVLLSVAFTIFYIGQRRADSVIFFSESLESAGIQLHVSDVRDFDTLRSAYARALASRAAYTRLEGADIDLMRHMVDRLDAAVASITELQSDDTSRSAMRALYPLSYLRALADAEESRRAFALSGTIADGNVYYARLESAVRAGIRDIRQFQDAFERIGAGGTNATPVGIVTTDSTRTYAAAVEHDLIDELMQVQSERACFRGDAGSCAPLVSPRTPSIEKELPQLDLSLARDVADLAYAGIGTTRPNTPLYVLGTSACAAHLIDGPYAFMADDDDSSAPHVRLVGDLVFYSPRTMQAPVLHYLGDELGVSRISLNPLKFYVCSGTVADISRVLALRHIGMYAKATGSYPDVFADGVISEKDAEGYLDQLSAEAQDEQRTTINSLRTELTTTRRIDAVLREMVRVHEKNIASEKTGVPIDINARTLFFTHNALASLYPPVENVSAAQVPAHLRDKLDEATELYSEIRDTVPRAVILNDLKTYAQFDDSAR